VSSTYKLFALHYNKHYNLAVAFASVTGAPFHDWHEYSVRGMTADEVVDLFNKYVAARDEKAIRLAILTGDYISKIEKPILMIDVDKLPDEYKNKKMELMKTFAKDGYQVVATPRGFHLMVFLDKSEKLPYVFRMFRENEDKRETVGEGGSLIPHPWSTVPSLRPLDNGEWFRYSFVTKDGELIASYQKYIDRQQELEPAVMTVNDVINDVSFYLGVETSVFSKFEETGRQPIVSIKDIDKKATIRKRPVFTTFEMFYASVHNTPLPLCVAWVLYHYALSKHDDIVMASISGVYSNFNFNRKVPHGMRFLVSTAVSLFLAHVIDWIKFDEIISVLEPAIEDFPHDSGYPLTRKLAYLFVKDDKGYVYPRYGGLGSLSPASVLNCEECVFSRQCRGRNPWRPYSKLVATRGIAEYIYEGQ